MLQYKAGQQEIAPDRHLGTQAPVSGSTVPWSLRVLPWITYTSWQVEGEMV